MIRGCFGFIAARCRVYQKIVDPPVIEALALRDACTFANEKGFAQVILESDCSDLVHLWTERVNIEQ